MKKVSVGIPVLNEAGNVPKVVERVIAAFPKQDPRARLLEIIFVDDGSTDATAAAVQALSEHDARVKLISFTRNFGHQMAISAAIDASSGDALVIMDGDLQDPPELIPNLLEAWSDGADIVYAQRVVRHGETAFKRATAYLFYRLLRLLSDVDLPTDAGDFSLLDRKVVSVLKSMPERNRYLRGLRAWTGFKAVGVPYVRAERASGRTKFSFSRMFSFAANGVVSFSIKPLRIAVYIGFFIFLVSVCAGFAIVSLWYWTDLLIPGWASIVVPIFGLAGVQLLVLGIMGEYIGRLYEEVRARPLYVVRDSIGVSTQE